MNTVVKIQPKDVGSIPYQEASYDIWDKKYRLIAKDGSPIDKSMDDTYKRVARALADPSPVVRRRYAELADDLEGADFLPLLSDPDAGVIEAACFAVGEVRDVRAVRRLCSIARDHEDALCRESAIAALGAIGDRAGLATILAGLSDRPPVRRRAVIALAPFEGPEVDDALNKALTDRDWQVRQAAEDQLRP